MPARKKAVKKVVKKAAKKAVKKAAKKAVKKAGKKAPRKTAPKRAKKAARRAVSRTPRPKATTSLPPAPPNGIGLTLHHMDFTTHSLDAVKRFYTETMGFTEVDHDPQMQYLFIRTGHSSSLGFMPPMPGMGEPSPAKEPTLYFFVDDVDKAYADLAAKGVHFEGPPADMPWGHRVVSTVDPEGRRVMLAMRTQTSS